MATSLVQAESPSKAEEKPARHGMQAQQCAELTAKQDLQKNFSISSSEDQRYANPPTGVGNANLAAACGDVTTGSAAATSSNGAARVLGNWADYTEDQRPGEDDDFTVVRNKRRRRDSPGSPTAAKHHSNPRGAGANSRPRSSTGWVPRADEIKTTRAHIAEARARQASSAEDNCVYVEYIPELEPYHYIRAVDRMIGGTNNVFQLSKINGHYLMRLNNRSLAERLISEGLEVEGTLFRAFPFRKRAMKITVGNLPFFVEDFTIISALTPYGRVTSIAPKLMKAGPYIYNDGRRDAFIVLHEGVTTERLPTRLEIKIKGEVWPAYLSYGIRCSRCHGQGHRRANCPLLAGRSNAPRPATPTSPTGVPPVTTPRPPQPPSAQPPPPASPSPAMEVSEVPSTSRAALHPPAAPRQSPPVAPAIPTEMAPPAPPPVTPAPSLRAPGSHGPGVPTLDVEMSIEETSTSSTSSSGTSTREGLVTFLERNPGVSFAQTDALGLGREEVLDLLSSKTKARKRGPLLSPSQGDALAGLIRQLLGLKPGRNSNIYKVLGQVRAALKTSPAAVPPKPLLPAPQPAGPIPPAPDEEEMTPIMREECMVIEIFKKLKHLTCLRPLYQSGIQPNDLKDAILFIDERESLMARLTPAMRGVLAEFLSAAIEPARGNHPDVSSDLARLTHTYSLQCKHYSLDTNHLLSYTNHIDTHYKQSRAAPTTQLLDLPIIGGFRFLRPPNLLAPSRWVGARVRDLGDDDHHTIVTPHPTRSALADAAALAAFCRRIVAENIQASYRVPSLAEAVVLRGTTKPLARITTRSARRALDRPRLAALPIHRLLARWTPTVDVPPRVDWTSLRRGALSGHNADVALRLALHALPHPEHPASAGPSCPACGSSDGSLGHRYWGCRTIRPLILEAFNIIGRPPDLQAWIFGTGLEQDDISILSSAKSRVYRHFIQ
ncbi:hypothetical protein LAZ67_X001518, partial [Cordylochernes scorpioides]